MIKLLIIIILAALLFGIGCFFILLTHHTLRVVNTIQAITGAKAGKITFVSRLPGRGMFLIFEQRGVSAAEWRQIKNFALRHERKMTRCERMARSGAEPEL